MTPAALQGDTPATARLQRPFSDLYFENMRFRSVGYLLRTPQCGGHWIAVLPSIVLGVAESYAVAGVLCDSLESAPFHLPEHDLEDLLTACALEGAALEAAADPNARNLRWGCFLVTDSGEAL